MGMSGELVPPLLAEIFLPQQDWAQIYLGPDVVVLGSAKDPIQPPVQYPHCGQNHWPRG